MSIWPVSLIGLIISHFPVRGSSHLDDGFFIDKLQGLLRQDAGLEVFDRVRATGLEHLHHLRHVHLQRARHLAALVVEVGFGYREAFLLRDRLEDQAELDALLGGGEALIPELPDIERLLFLIACTDPRAVPVPSWLTSIASPFFLPRTASSSVSP